MAREIREQLADYAHQAWAAYMTYLLDGVGTNADGSVTIPAGYVANLRRQAATPYAELTQDEQASDLAEADAMLAIVRGAMLEILQG